MASKEELSLIVERAKEQESLLKELSSWSKTFQFDVTDEPHYFVEINQGKLSLKDGDSESPAAKITASGEVLSDLFSGKLNPVQAFMSGKLKVTGDIFSTQKLTSIINKARK